MEKTLSEVKVSKIFSICIPNWSESERKGMEREKMKMKKTLNAT